MPKDIAIYKGDNIRDKKLVDATSADTVASGDSIVIKTVSGDYVEVDMNSFTDAVKGVLGKLISDNDKGTSISGITVTDGNDDLGSVTPANLAVALNDYISGSTPTLQAAAGANIGSVGTPSVTATTVGSTTTFTFNYLKGATGAQGPQGPQGPTGPQGPGCSVSGIFDGMFVKTTWYNNQNLDNFARGSFNTWCIGENCSNNPGEGWGYLINIPLFSDSIACQIYIEGNTNRIFLRTYHFNSGWRGWHIL